MANTLIARRAVILTALPFEYKAVHAHLQNPHEHVDDRTVYEIGTFVAPPYIWEVCIAEIGIGNEGAALAAQGAINYFKPEVAFFVGVAGGLQENELTLGMSYVRQKSMATSLAKTLNMALSPGPKWEILRSD